MYEVLYDTKITKVLHSGRQDLEILYILNGRLPEPIFDTQIAAPLLGLIEQISYADYISEILGINLEKSHTRTNWSQRPLTEQQLQYALNDVIYLGQAYELTCNKLRKLDRIDWLKDDFAALLDPILYQAPAENAWLRIRAANKLNSASLSVLQHLAKWREETARNLNLPRNWLLKDDSLVNIARFRPSSTDELNSLRGLHDRTLKKHGKSICKLVEEAKNQQPIALQPRSKSSRKTLQQEALVKLLTGIVHLRASEQSINPEILAGKKEIEKLVIDPYSTKIMKGWRKSLIGDELSSILSGEKSISVVNGVIQVEIIQS